MAFLTATLPSILRLENTFNMSLPGVRPMAPCCVFAGSMSLGAKLHLTRILLQRDIHNP